MDIAYKIGRVRRFSRLIGIYEALLFELKWTLRRSVIHIRFDNQDLIIRRDTSDISVFESVFCQKEFAINLGSSNNSIIIDGGANVGYSTVFLAKRFPESTIVAIEPSDENLKVLEYNCHGLGNIKVLKGGLWSDQGDLKIKNPTAASWSFKCEVSDQSAPDSFPAYTVDGILDKNGFRDCALLKLDIEGAEEELFAKPDGWIDRVACIMVEVHSDQAREAIEAACPEKSWLYSRKGEKLVLSPRHRQMAN